MGITEPKQQKQIHFCCLCGGPGVSRKTISGAEVRVCAVHRDQTNRVLYERAKRPKSANPNVSAIKWRRTPEDVECYRRKRAVFLKGNPYCEVALALRVEKVAATHVHHRNGRNQHYLDETTFVATTFEGDRWIHANPDQARALGFLA